MQNQKRQMSSKTSVPQSAINSLSLHLLREQAAPLKEISNAKRWQRTSLLLQESCWDHNFDADFSFSGPGFGIYAVVHLLLPVMSLWLRRSHKDHSYWDVASANFKHAIGLSCELVVEHIQSFIHSGIYSTHAVRAEYFLSRQHHCLKVLSKQLMQVPRHDFCPRNY